MQGGDESAETVRIAATEPMELRMNRGISGVGGRI